MNESTIYRIAAGIVLAIVLIGGVFIFWHRSGQAGDAATTTPSSATPSEGTSDTHTTNGVTGTGNFTVSGVDSIDVPDFRAPITYSADLSADAKAIIQKNVATLQATLQKNSLDLKAWLDLGAMRKMAGDFAGAETDWKFVTQASPKNTAAFWNLGDLYMNFLKNYPKAESAFKSVIAIEPTNTQAYQALFQLYTDLYKQGTGAAESILKQAIAANPDSVDMQVTLARYYKSQGRAADAKAEYDAAIANATRQHQTNLAAQIKTEAGE